MTTALRAPTKTGSEDNRKQCGGGLVILWNNAGTACRACLGFAAIATATGFGPALDLDTKGINDRGDAFLKISAGVDILTIAKERPFRFGALNLTTALQLGFTAGP